MRQTSYHIHPSWPLTCFARGMVVVMLMAVTLVMFNRLGMSNMVATLITSLLLLPMAFRPVLSPVVRAWGLCKWWMVISLFVFAGAMYVVADHIASFPDNGTMWTALVVAALAGACFDTAAVQTGKDTLRQKNYRALKYMVPCKLMAVVVVMGVMLLLAGNMEVVSRNIEESWQLAFKAGAAIVMATALLLWVAVFRMHETGKRNTAAEAWQQRREELADWWTADGKRWLFVLFVLVFPLHEFFLWRGTLLFLVDRGSTGGLSFSPQEIGFAWCSVATIIAMAGYVMGVSCLRKNGLKTWWWPMALAFTVPDAVYIFLAYVMPEELWLVTLCLSVEQWCCGFGMAAFVLYIMYGNGETCKEVHIDVCWSLVITSIVFSGCFTGALQDYFGYRRFFIVVLLLAIIALAIIGWMAIKRLKTSINP